MYRLFRNFSASWALIMHFSMIYPGGKTMELAASNLRIYFNYVLKWQQIIRYERNESPVDLSLTFVELLLLLCGDIERNTGPLIHNQTDNFSPELPLLLQNQKINVDVQKEEKQTKGKTFYIT